ncbi:hypothetical protein [Dasania marina]|uniref:hypothetical protein n=1 Tax=Dasania marina TaxID=471499 RepID=UPI0030DA90DF|tara:strand:+ start:64655 stop:65401 length:747 start_codon:yes stop_codon:yes gene_type:complete
MDQQQPLYDVYFTGKLVDDISPEQAQQAVAQLFKTQPAKIAHLFNGQTHILKRGLAKDAALKYKAVLRKAGLSILFKMSSDAATAPPPVTATTAAVAEPQTTAAVAEQGALTIAPVGSDVLAAHERRVVVTANIDTSNIKLSSPFLDNIEQTSATGPAPPDTSHISVAEVGANILSEPRPEAVPLPLDIDDITLAPAGAILEELHPDLPELNPDISGISLAPAGADLLTEKKPSAPPAPDTSHLSLKP